MQLSYQKTSQVVLNSALEIMQPRRGGRWLCNHVLLPMLGYDLGVQVLRYFFDVICRFSLGCAYFMDQLEVLPDRLQKNREHLALSLQEAEERILQGVAMPLEGLKLSRQKVDVELYLLL
jgi:hypothetical protein